VEFLPHRVERHLHVFDDRIAFALRVESLFCGAFRIGTTGKGTLNEQTCDSGGAPPCSGATSSGITVRAIHVIVDNPNAPGVPQGADVIVAEAHADSSHP